jgi:hypothetical protein
VVLAGFWLPRFEAAESLLPLWDQRIYFGLAANLTAAVNSSMDETIAVLKNSLLSTHNAVYALPIAVAQFGAELTWPSYRRGLVLLFLVPTVIANSLLAASVVTRSRLATFWIAVAITSTLPALWDATLKYYPDVSGLVLICVAFGILSSKVEKRSSLIVMLFVGTLFAGAILLRRHFVYAAASAYFAYFGVCAFRVVIQAARGGGGRYARTKAAGQIFHLCFTCFVSGLGLCLLLHLIAPVYFQLLFLDQSSLYAAYRVPADQLAFRLLSSAGGVATALSVLGLWLGHRARLTKPLFVPFMIAYLIIWLMLWFTTAKYSGPQYLLHVFPILQGTGLTLLVLMLCARGKRVGSLFGALLVAGLLYRQWIHPLAGIGEDYRITALLGPPSSPNRTHQPDRESYIKLVHDLREGAGDQKKVFVAASSVLMSAPLIESVDEMWVRAPGQAPLKVLQTPDVDARDGLPVAELIGANLVVVAYPIQYHLPPSAQAIVELAALSTVEAHAFSAGFRRWNQEYEFVRGGFRVLVYERVHVLDVKAGLDLVEHLTSSGAKGGASWFPLQGAQKNIAGANSDGSYWLYYEPLLQEDPAGGASFGSALLYSGRILVKAELRVSGCEPKQLSLHLVPKGQMPTDPVAVFPLKNTAANEYSQIEAEVSLTSPSRLMSRVSSRSGVCNVYFKVLRVSRIDG